MALYITGALCGRVIVDKATNMVSLIDLIRGGAVDKFPFEAPEITVYGDWEASSKNEKKFSMRHTVCAPGGKEILSEDSEHPIKSGRTRTVAVIGGFIAEEPGRYTIATYTKRGRQWDLVAEYPLMLKLQPSPTPKESPDKRSVK
ncbi:MAG: hypothetical protein KKF77_12730 [Proteobacteria bacterium]|nr:hypothetical protein [Pseudomonadota bacterium]